MDKNEETAFNNAEPYEVYCRIRNLSFSHELSLNMLENSINVEEGSSDKWKKEFPTVEMLQDLSVELNTSIDYILYGENSKNILRYDVSKMNLSNYQLSELDNSIRMNIFKFGYKEGLNH